MQNHSLLKFVLFRESSFQTLELGSVSRQLNDLFNMAIYLNYYNKLLLRFIRSIHLIIIGVVSPYLYQSSLFRLKKLGSLWQ